METNNPTQDANAQGNANANNANAQEQNQPTAQGVKYVMPTALAGQDIVAPKAITAKLVNASARTLENGEPVIVLEFAGFPANVLRTMPQVKGDLIEHYNRETLDVMSPVLATASYKKFFKNKLTKLTASYHEAGAIQTLDANSRLVKNLEHPIGAKVPTEKEGIWVEGFLSVEITEAELDAIIERELQSIAKAKANEAGFAI